MWDWEFGIEAGLVKGMIIHNGSGAPQCSVEELGDNNPNRKNGSGKEMGFSMGEYQQ